jgi:hypothetical protein
MAHFDVPVDPVAVSPAYPLTLDEAAVDQVGEDPLGRTLRDADVFGNVTKPDLGVAGDAEENLGVVGDESPAAHCFLCP